MGDFLTHTVHVDCCGLSTIVINDVMIINVIILCCDGLMCQLVGEFCRLDLTCPVPGCGPHEVRTLLLEGMLRLRESNSAKVRGLPLIATSIRRLQGIYIY